jgi:hypothetical protein
MTGDMGELYNDLRANRRDLRERPMQIARGPALSTSFLYMTAAVTLIAATIIVGGAIYAGVVG